MVMVAKPKKMVTMRIQMASTPEGRALGENVIFFEYPEGLGLQRPTTTTTRRNRAAGEDGLVVHELQLEAKTVNLRTSNEQRSLINATTLAGIGRDFFNYSLSWAKHFAEHYAGVRSELQPWHKLNHLPSSHLLSHKDFLARSIAHQRRRFPADDIDGYGKVCPETFVLPFDKARLVEVLEAEPDSLWIEKPYAASRGRGITVWSARDKDKLLHKVSQPRKQLPPDLQNTRIKLKQPADPAAVVIQRCVALNGTIAAGGYC